MTADKPRVGYCVLNRIFATRAEAERWLGSLAAKRPDYYSAADLDPSTIIEVPVAEYEDNARISFTRKKKKARPTHPTNKTLVEDYERAFASGAANREEADIVVQQKHGALPKKDRVAARQASKKSGKVGRPKKRPGLLTV
jgi:hypothetical protein